MRRLETSGVAAMNQPESPAPSADQQVSRRARMVLAALLALGLTARVAMALFLGEERAAPTVDAWANLALGRSMAEGDGFVLRQTPALAQDTPGPPERMADRMPGYPFAVAAAQRLSDQGLRLLAVVQAVLGVAAMLVAFLIASRLAGPWAGVGAAALLTFDPHQVFASAIVLPIVPLGLVLLVFLAAGFRFYEAVEQGRRTRWLWAAVAGVLLALAAYLDVTMAGLGVLAGLVALLSRFRVRLLAGWAVGMAVVVAALVPWAMRNDRTVGSPVLTTNVGVRLYDTAAGAGPHESATKGNLAAEVRGCDDAAADAIYARAAVEEIRAAPGEWLKSVARRAARIWSPWPVERPGCLPLLPVSGYTSLLPMAAFAAVGIGAMRRRRAALVWLLAAPVWVTIAGAVLAGCIEQRLPAMPVVAVLSGVGLAAVIGRMRESRPPAAGQANSNI
jgi:4-amino-4-deoxy-L-arabinose transferase-like glycosyltransferase